MVLEDPSLPHSGELVVSNNCSNAKLDPSFSHKDLCYLDQPNVIEIMTLGLPQSPTVSHSLPHSP